MDVVKETILHYYTGVGGADIVPRPLVSPGYAPQTAIKFVRVRAHKDNTTTVYVGRNQAEGFPLDATEQIDIPVDNPSSVYVSATPAANTTQIVTLEGQSGEDTFTLAGCEPIAYNALAADVQTTLEFVFGANVSVGGSAGGPYTVEFTGDLAKTDVAAMVGTVTNGTISIAATQASAGSRYAWLVV